MSVNSATKCIRISLIMQRCRFVWHQRGVLEQRLLQAKQSQNVFSANRSSLNRCWSTRKKYEKNRRVLMFSAYFAPRSDLNAPIVGWRILPSKGGVLFRSKYSTSRPWEFVEWRQGRNWRAYRMYAQQLTKTWMREIASIRQISVLKGKRMLGSEMMKN